MFALNKLHRQVLSLGPSRREEKETEKMLQGWLRKLLHLLAQHRFSIFAVWLTAAVCSHLSLSSSLTISLLLRICQCLRSCLCVCLSTCFCLPESAFNLCFLKDTQLSKQNTPSKLIYSSAR